jgi:peptidoglycan/LPS O-acetylase OafA/YrhL
VILLREQKQKQRIDFRLFYMRRILRIFPIYYLALIFGVLICPLFLAGEPRFANIASYIIPIFIPYALFIGNFSAAFNQVSIQNLEYATHFSPSTFTGPFWSLCVEEQFYFVWPFTLSKIKSAKSFFTVTVGVALASGVIRYFFFQLANQMHGLYAPHAIYYSNTLCRVDALMMGAAVAGLVVYTPAAFDRLQKYGAHFFIGALLIYFGVVGFVPSIYGNVITIVPTFSAIALAFGALLVSCMVWSPLGKIFSQEAIAHFGRLTFAMYLFHRPVIISYRWLFDQFWKKAAVVPVLYWGCEFLVCLLVTYSLSRVSWWLIESRCAALRRKLELVPTGIVVEN